MARAISRWSDWVPNWDACCHRRGGEGGSCPAGDAWWLCRNLSSPLSLCSVLYKFVQQGRGSCAGLVDSSCCSLCSQHRHLPACSCCLCTWVTPWQLNIACLASCTGWGKYYLLPQAGRAGKETFVSVIPCVLYFPWSSLCIALR